MAEALGLTCTVNTPALPVTGGQRLVYLLLEVSGDTGSEVLPVNLALVVDVSESMYIRVATDEQFREIYGAEAVRVGAGSVTGGTV